MINKLINLCNDTEQREGKTIYRGFIGDNYLGFDKHLTNDFKPMLEAFNGYREVYYSEIDLCSITTCEGDISVVTFGNMQALENDYNHALKFYEEH